MSPALTWLSAALCYAGVALGALGCNRPPRPQAEALSSTALSAPVLPAQALVARPVRAKTPLTGPSSVGSEIVPLEAARGALATPDSSPLVPELQIEAHFEWPAQARTLRLVGLSSSDAQAALAATRQVVSIVLQADGYLQWTFETSAFPVPQGTRLQARFTNFGHLLVWPDASKYRVLPTGTLRALLRERRVDATPILVVKPTQRPAEPRFGLPTEELSFDGPLGKLALRVAKAEEAGRGGPLLCRLLLEFLAIAPQSDACETGRVPVLARFDFGHGAALLFVVDKLTRHPEAAKHLVVPPDEVPLVTKGLPKTPDAYLGASTLALTSRSSETASLSIRNGSPYAGFVLVDGVPLSFVQPFETRQLPGLGVGTYNVAVRSFFGDELVRQTPIPLPQTQAAEGRPDAGTEL